MKMKCIISLDRGTSSRFVTMPTTCKRAKGGCVARHAWLGSALAWGVTFAWPAWAQRLGDSNTPGIPELPVAAVTGDLPRSTAGSQIKDRSESSEKSPEKQHAGEPIETLEIRARRSARYDASRASAATKTNVLVMQLPQSVQVVPGRLLEDQQVRDMSQALENVSGLQRAGAGRRGLIDRFVVRGFPLDSQRNFYRDGLPFVFAAPPPPEAVDRVEFVKGPASVLYGQAEPGGVVNLVLKRPTQTSFVRGRIQAGSFRRYQGHIDAGGPLTGTFGYRANASYLSAGSFRDFQHTGRHVLTTTFTYRPSAWCDLDLSAGYQGRRQRADSGLIAGLGLPRSRSLNEPWTEIALGAGDAAYRARFQLSDGFTLRHTASWQRQETDELRADPLAVQSAVPLLGIESGDLARAMRDRNTQRLTHYADLNLLGRFETGPAAHRLLLGSDLFRSVYGFTEMRPIIEPSDRFNVYRPQYSPLPPPGTGSSVLDLSRATLLQAGAYIQDQLTFDDWVHVLTGLRVDRFKDRLDKSRLDTNATTVLNQARTGATARAGVIVNPVEFQAFFLSYAQGFRPNIDPFFDSPLPPERSAQWEFGGKLELGSLLMTLTGFELTKTNVAIINPVSQVLNLAGERRARGLEIDLVGDLLPGWSLLVSYAQLAAHIAKGDPRPLGTPGVGTVDFTGNVPPASPRSSGRVWTTYRIERGLMGGLRLGLGALGRSAVQADIFNRARHSGFVRLDAMLGWSQRFGSYELDAQLNLENVTDQAYFSGYAANFVKPGAPRTVLVQVSLTARAGKERGA